MKTDLSNTNSIIELLNVWWKFPLMQVRNLQQVACSHYMVPPFQIIVLFSFVLSQTSLSLSKFIEKCINIYNIKLVSMFLMVQQSPLIVSIKWSCAAVILIWNLNWKHVQRHLQLRIEAQGKYLQAVLEQAQETLGKQNLGPANLEDAKIKMTSEVYLKYFAWKLDTNIFLPCATDIFAWGKSCGPVVEGKSWSDVWLNLLRQLNSVPVLNRFLCWEITWAPILQLVPFIVFAQVSDCLY